MTIGGMSTHNGTVNGKPKPRPKLSPTAKEHQRRLDEARLEARALVAERHLRRLKETALLDFDWVGPWAEVLARSQLEPGWFPLNTPSARRYGHYFPFFQTEQQLALIRDLSRILVGTNNHAAGMLNGLTSFVVGTGYKFKVTPNDPSAKPLVSMLTDWLDSWAEANDWEEFQQEAFWRSREDGESFIRMFPDDDGLLKVRFVWPEQIRQKPGGTVEEWGYGVKTPADDAARVEAFWVGALGDPTDGEEVDEQWVIHLKSNTRTGIKRGLPDFAFGTKDALDTAVRLTKNLGEGGAIRAAIAYIREHAAGGVEEVSEFVAAGADYRTKIPFRDAFEYVTDVRPGTVLDVPEGFKHVPPPADPQSESHAAVVALLLRSAGVRWNAPEWLVSGDASNMGAYTSSLVAESPFVKSVVRAQNYYRRRFLRVVRKAIELSDLPPNILSAVTVDLVPPSPEVRDKDKEADRAAKEIPLGVQSRQNYCSEQGRDFDRIAEENQEYQDTWGADSEAPIPGISSPGDTGQPPPAPTDQPPSPRPESRLREGAPGPPPRPGLVWNESTHRWRNPDTGEEHPHEPQGGRGDRGAGLPSDADLAGATVEPLKVAGAVHGAGGLSKVTVGDRSFFFKAASPSEARREEATAAAAAAAGVNVPPARLATVGGKAGVLSGWAEGKSGEADRAGLEKAVADDPHGASKLALFHFVAGAEDRHRGNLIVGPHGIASLDHGDALDPNRSAADAARLLGQDDVMAAMEKAGGGSVTFDPKAVSEIAAAVPEMAAALRERGMEKEAKALEARGKVVAELAKAEKPTEAELARLSGGARAESLLESAPGPPPRPGLVWNEGTHRWRDPDTGEEHPHEGGGGGGKKARGSPGKARQTAEAIREVVDETGGELSDAHVRSIAAHLATHTPAERRLVARELKIDPGTPEEMANMVATSDLAGEARRRPAELAGTVRELVSDRGGALSAVDVRNLTEYLAGFPQKALDHLAAELDLPFGDDEHPTAEQIVAAVTRRPPAQP